MYNNFYLQNKRVEEHLQDLQREANQQRIVADLPRHRRSLGKHIVSRLGTQLVALGTWLEHIEQHDKEAVATYR
ncbi:MAG: hypothetical protein ACJ797_19880 [Ktedonobacteraceae bacterium]